MSGVAAQMIGDASGALAARHMKADGTVKVCLVPYRAVRRFGFDGACERYGFPKDKAQVDFTGCSLVLAPCCGLAFYVPDEDNPVCPTDHAKE